MFVYFKGLCRKQFRKDFTHMKLNGTQKFAAPRTQVYNAILNPEVLKASIPGADTVKFNTPNQLHVDITLPFPGLHGPFGVLIDVPTQDAPNRVDFKVAHTGKGGSVDTTCQITLTDEADGTLLTYNANAELEGLIAVANNPIGQGIVKSKLAEFFKNLEKEVTQARV
jgi:uncharacterized protein